MAHDPLHPADGQPLSVADLLGRYLARQVEAQLHGLGHPEPTGDAFPHDIGAVQPVEPRLAFADAVAAADSFLLPGKPKFPVPPDWPTLVAGLEPAFAVAFALGNFPQMVRDVAPLLAGEPLTLPAVGGEPLAVPRLLEWAERAADDATRLLAAGALRLARQFDAAERLLAVTPSPNWEAPHANELAALAWHRGDAAHALTLWQHQQECPAVLFNRGMATLFLGDAGSAVVGLRHAVVALPETGAWHHLASLYLTLAETR